MVVVKVMIFFLNIINLYYNKEITNQSLSPISPMVRSWDLTLVKTAASLRQAKTPNSIRAIFIYKQNHKN